MSKTMQSEWTVSLKVIDRDKRKRKVHGSVIFDAQLDCVSELLPHTILAVINKAEERLELYKQFNE